MPHLQRRRRAILLAVGLAVVTAVIPTAPGSATASFTFYGSGFGHGLGMSQWGAYGLALRGWTTDQILTHYYSHTVVQQAGAAPSLLRIGLTQGRSTIHLQAINGDVTLRIGNSTDGALVGRIPSPQTWVVTTVSGRYRILNANGNRVGGRDWGDATHNLYASYADVGARVKVPEGGATYNRGFLEFNLYACGPCQMRVILTIPPRAYLYGLAEVPSSWPMAALRAQAIAGRSYAFVKAASGQHRTGCNCALYDSSSDQVYIGWNKEFGTDGWRWVLAVNQTAGQVVTYQGATVEAEYMSSSGGYTENNENVWGGTPLPWLRGVCDPGDYTSANPNRVWSVTFSTAQVTSALRPYTGDIGTVVGFGDARRGVSGRIESVPVSGGTGSATVTGIELRVALGIRDDRVWINTNRNVTGDIRTKYDSLGCAPGLPTAPAATVPGGSRQWFVTGGIYRNVDANVTVWLRGPIYDEYLSTGGVRGGLGLPRTGLMAMPGLTGCGGGACSKVLFDHGRIYWKNGVGAFALLGSVLTAYVAYGGAPGQLAFPTSRVQVNDDGSSSATFEHGSISCPTGGGACTVSVT